MYLCAKLKSIVKMSVIEGKISKVIGPVVDVRFEIGVSLPNIYDALEVRRADGTRVVRSAIAYWRKFYTCNLHGLN